MNEHILAEQTHAAVRAVTWQAAVLPFGATEPHNLHMPYGTDTFQVEDLAARACVVQLPAIPYGVNTNHLKIKGAWRAALCRRGSAAGTKGGASVAAGAGW